MLLSRLPSLCLHRCSLRSGELRARLQPIRCAARGTSSAMQPPLLSEQSNAPILDLVARIHATPSKAVVYVTGGAVQVTAPLECSKIVLLFDLAVHASAPCNLLSLQALTWLLSVPGASHTVLEACVPYSRDSLVDILGQVGTCGAQCCH
jgi:hypothetical protein